MDDDRFRKLVTGTAAVRIAIGAAALLTPRLALRLFSFPAAHDNASARLIGRLFGVREVLIGVFTTVAARSDPRQRRRLYQFNAAVDGSDAVLALLTLAGRRGLARATVSAALLALPLSATWWWLSHEADC